MSAGCWADSLTMAERVVLAPKIARAARFFGAGAMVVARQGRDAEADMLNRASADMSDLYMDVTERAEVAR